jgi:diguanylate cyclase (GGDEF)-like protein
MEDNINSQLNSEKHYLTIVMVQVGVAIFFSCLAYWAASPPTLFLSVGCGLVVSLSLFKASKSLSLGIISLSTFLTLGFLYVTMVSADAVALIWCVTIFPALVLITNPQKNVYIGIALIIAHLKFNHQLNIKKLQAVQFKANTIDDVTGLQTRNSIEKLLFKKFTQTPNEKTTTSAIVLDIDNFRSINERYGHKIGNDLLCSVSKLLGTTLADEYIFGRWDGNAFIIILPHDNDEVSLLIAETLRQKINGNQFNIQEHSLSIACSVGIASSKKSHDLNDFLSQIENNLYQAKSLGGNQSIFS